MHRQGTDAGDVCRRKRAADRVLQQGCAKSLTLVIHRHGQSGQHHQRNQMACQPLANPFGGLLRAHLTHHQDLEAHHDIPASAT